MRWMTNADELQTLSRVRGLVANRTAKPIRLAARLSLSEVAQVVGVSSAAVCRWEAGDRQPRGEAGVRYGELLESLLRGGSKR